MSFGSPATLEDVAGLSIKRSRRTPCPRRAGRRVSEAVHGHRWLAPASHHHGAGIGFSNPYSIPRAARSDTSASAVGMRHAPPRILDAFSELASTGVDRVVAIILSTPVLAHNHGRFIIAPSRMRKSVLGGSCRSPSSPVRGTPCRRFCMPWRSESTRPWTACPWDYRGPVFRLSLQRTVCRKSVVETRAALRRPAKNKRRRRWRRSSGLKPGSLAVLPTKSAGTYPSGMAPARHQGAISRLETVGTRERPGRSNPIPGGPPGDPV